MLKLRQTLTYRVLLYAALILLLISVVILGTNDASADRRFAYIAGGFAIVVVIGWLIWQGGQRFDDRLARELGWFSLRRLHVYNKSFPAYRFVDIFLATERYWNGFTSKLMIESLQNEDLNSIVNGQFYAGGESKQVKPPLVSREVGWHKEEFFPTDRFWIVKPNDGAKPDGPSILRMRVHEYTGEAVLEIAAHSSEEAERVTEEILRDSIEHSIYRNQLLQISFEGGVTDEFGDVESAGNFSLRFIARKQVTTEQIILDDDVQRILKRNVFDFHRRRKELQKHGVPSKKGILFYGPPGTGKTYTCQYIYSNLLNVTTLVVTGQSLLHVKTLCNLARMLQPSLLVLEDVDLIFASREINLYSTALGDLMDELDGFQSDEPITFLLTTNAIDRLEQAIKDRPGRINQCVFFGPPNPDLRLRYIQRYLHRYDASALNLDNLVADTNGSSQAFIKEVIFRAVQIAMEDPSRNGETVRLADGDFTTALDEMTRYSEKATSTIMGFKSK